MTILTPQQGGETKKAPAFGLTSKGPPVLTFVEPTLSLDYIRMLIIGEQGSGKTRLASSILDVPRVEGVLYVDADRGLFTGRHAIERHPEKIHIKHISQENPIAEMTDIIRWLKFATNREKAAENGLPYIDTVVIDTISFLGNRTIGKLGEGANAVLTGLRPENNQTSSIAEYNLQKVFIEGWVDQVNALPCHHIATVHMDLVRNEKKLTWMPTVRLPGKLGNALPSYYRQVHWLSVVQQPEDPKHPGERTLPKHVLLCRPEGDKMDGLREAKDCSDTLPFTIENPTMKELFGYFFGQQ